jgi:hypothetical protein
MMLTSLIFIVSILYFPVQDLTVHYVYYNILPTIYYISVSCTDNRNIGSASLISWSFAQLYFGVTVFLIVPL